MKGVIVQ